MKGIWMSSVVAAMTLAAGIAVAQTPPPPAPGGAFESLSPGNQKIALAIFESERRGGQTLASRPLSLDEIAGMKQDGKGWGVIFKEMKSQGLVQDRNLGQAVSRMSRSGATAARTEITAGSGKTAMVGGKDRSGSALSGRQTIGSDDAVGGTAPSTAASHSRDGGVGATTAHGGGGSHGNGRGKW